MKAMLFAAGRGTRLKPLTEQHPKCLVQAGGKTLLEHNLDFLKQAGVNTVIINVHHLAEQVIAFVSRQDFGIELIISQENELLETGGGLLKARDHFVDEDCFVVSNSDIYTDLNLGAMIEAHQRNSNLATLAVARRETSRYLRFNQAHLLCGWENRSNGESISWNTEPYEVFAFNGIQILSPEVFEHMSGLGPVFSTIPVYLQAAQRAANIQAYPMDESYWVDVGTLKNLELLRTHLAKTL